MSASPTVIGVLVFISLTWSAAPRCFRAADRACARRRLAAPVLHIDPPRALSNTAHRSTRTRGARSDTDTSSESGMCEALATLTLTGLPPRDALQSLCARGPVPAGLRRILLRNLHDHMPLASCLDETCAESRNTGFARPAHLLRVSFVAGSFVPGALQAAAAVLRRREALLLELLVHTAHARITARFLTALPFVVVAVGAVSSGSFRGTLTTGPVVIALVLGLVLALAGWSWMRRLTALAVAGDDAEGLADLSFSLFVSLHAGLTLVESCLQWRHVNPTGSRIADGLDAQQPLRAALEPLGDMFGAHGRAMMRTLCDAASSGLPLVDTAHRVHDELQRAREAQTAMRVQQLSTKLSVPVVLCSLPSFVLVALMPLAVTGLSTMSV